MFAALQAGGIRIVHAPDPELRAGLTGALAGIADSGTLLLAGAVDRPLTASLLPEIHLAVLQAEVIYENLPAVLRLREVKEASALTLITGPSRTADIEMTLTIGVHGPRAVHVICIRQHGSGSAPDQYNGSDNHNQDKSQGERPA
jgi:L-lactate dehydrogenase complex protein LldG